MLSHIKSYFHLSQQYPTQSECIKLLEQILWNGTPVSPFDAESRVYKCKNKYKCRNTGKYFTVLNNTMFENTKLPLTSWFYAIWKLTTSGSGITSVDLANDMGITQKSAWFMLHRIRACMEVENNHELDGTIECDETWIGGKNGNRHKSKKVDYKASKKENPDKALVIGMKQRGGKIVMKVVRDRSRESLQPVVQQYVSNGANLITDELGSYSGLSVVYNHTSINHSAYEYVSLENKSHNNNSIEGEWSILKRCVSGTYRHVADKHLQSYTDESAYRANMRDLTTSDRFHWLLAHCNKRTTLKDIIGRKCVRETETPFKTIYKGTRKGRELDKPNFKPLKK